MSDQSEDPKDHQARLDRELIELLNELRVALPGVQVLLAFMLTIPFSQRFGSLTSGQRATFIAALLMITAASALLMAPTAYHRLRWRQGDKEHMLVTSNRLAIGGIGLLALGLVTVVFLVLDILLSAPVAAAIAFAAAVLIAWLWFALPLSRRPTRRPDDSRR
jgi:cobalamin synthase